MEVDSEIGPHTFALLGQVVDGAHVEGHKHGRVNRHKDCVVVAVDIELALHKVRGNLLQ